MVVADYVTNFEELSKFCPHYIGVDVKGSKCVKFGSGWHPEIKQFIGYQKILHFSVLVNNCNIYDEDNIERSICYKSVNDNKFGN